MANTYWFWVTNGRNNKRQELPTLREDLSSSPVLWWGPCWSFTWLFVCPIMCLYVLSSMLCPLRFLHIHEFQFVFTPSRFMFYLRLFVFVCRFLWIVHFWFPLRYSLTFISILYFKFRRQSWKYKTIIKRYKKNVSIEIIKLVKKWGCILLQAKVTRWV